MKIFYSLAALFLVPTLHAQPALDLGFGTQGVATAVLAPLGSGSPTTLKVFEQKGGRLIHVAHVDRNPESEEARYGYTLTGFTKDGAPDRNFGSEGQLFFDAPAPVSALLLSDDRFLVLLDQTDHFELRRHLPNGFLDESYGNQGTLTIPFDRFVSAGDFSSTKLQNGGFALAFSSYTRNESFHINVVLVRLKNDGTLDTNVGEGGLSEFDYFPEHPEEWIRSIVELNNGNIWISGYVREDDQKVSGLIACHTRNNKLCQDFGKNGLLLLQSEELNSTFDEPIVHTLQTWGDSVYAGVYSVDCPGIVRLNRKGEIDRSYGKQGIASFCASLRTEHYNLSLPLKVDEQGGLWVRGYSTRWADGGDYFKGTLLLGRFNADGTVDSSFGSADRPYLALPYVEGFPPSGFAGASFSDSRGRLLLSLDSHYVLNQEFTMKPDVERKALLYRVNLE